MQRFNRCGEPSATDFFRIRIVNKVNDNFDYFYIKNADSSRVYGLELEHLLSPNRISYLTSGDTLIEEHIAGILGDMFIKSYLQDANLNPIRLCKEFVKFNERCFVRLLGDVFGISVRINETNESGCVGAIWLAMKALGEIPSLEAGVEKYIKFGRTYEPNQANATFYSKHVKAFAKLI